MGVAAEAESLPYYEKAVPTGVGRTFETLPEPVMHLGSERGIKGKKGERSRVVNGKYKRWRVKAPNKSVKIHPCWCVRDKWILDLHPWCQTPRWQGTRPDDMSFLGEWVIAENKLNG